MHKRKRISGIRISYIFLPTIIAIVIIHILIILCTVFIDSNTEKLSNESDRTTKSINEITSIISYSSKLSDTAASFIYTPTIPAGPEQGQINTGPLYAYFEEIADKSKRPDNVATKILSYNLPRDVQNLVDTSINNLKVVLKNQQHAFNLINNCVALPESIFSEIGEYELTDAEKAYTLDEAKVAAFNLLFSQEYSIAKRDIANNVTEAKNLIISDSAHVQKAYNDKISILKIWLWVFISLILTVTVVFIILLLTLLVFPLLKSARKIYENTPLGENNKLYETNLLAKAYNNLLDKHKEFAVELRTVAEQDSLTGLPNRYSYNEFLKRKAPMNTRCCAFLFDINRLKYTNDTFGHSAGDVLIKKSSMAIKESFQDEKNVFRIGGDEFVVVLHNIDIKEVDEYLEDFKAAEKAYDVSVAVGYSYTYDISKIGYEKLISEADTLMYENKRKSRE